MVTAVRRIQSGWLAADQHHGHARALLEQLTGNDEAVAAVIAPPAQHRYIPSHRLIAGTNHACGGAAGVFHQPQIIEAVRHCGRLKLLHFPGCQYLHFGYSLPSAEHSGLIELKTEEKKKENRRPPFTFITARFFG